ncbi:LOL2B oxidase, partial [Amia calva]|nr:LOL2B oxidase [Amia calva]
MGYLEAISWSPASKYGKGEGRIGRQYITHMKLVVPDQNVSSILLFVLGRIWMDNVHCTGKEKTLALCTSNGLGVSDCKHTEDVGVVCSDKRIPGFKFISSLTNNIEAGNCLIDSPEITFAAEMTINPKYLYILLFFVFYCNTSTYYNVTKLRLDVTHYTATVPTFGYFQSCLHSPQIVLLCFSVLLVSCCTLICVLTIIFFIFYWRRFWDQLSASNPLKKMSSKAFSYVPLFFCSVVSSAHLPPFQSHSLPFVGGRVRGGNGTDVKGISVFFRAPAITSHQTHESQHRIAVILLSKYGPLCKQTAPFHIDTALSEWTLTKTPSPQKSLNIQVEDVRIRPILATYRKRIPVTEGYVEVKDGGSWRQICNEEWSEMNSRVICGMFGFPGERKYNARVYKLTFSPSPCLCVFRMFARKRKHNYWDYSVNCTGNEAHVSACKLGHTVVEKGNGTCQQGMPVVVSCVPGRAFAPSSMTGFRKAFRQEQPLVRLKGGAIVGEGRVEVLKNGEWGTICDDNWSLLAATVVCRELGFGSAKEALSGAKLGQGMGPVNMNEVECSGFEKSITECFFNKDALDCNHEEDAAVRCNVPAMGFQERLRLTGGRNPFEGRVEVLAEKNGTLVWGTVCSEGWGTMEAMVVCRQLGLGFANHAFQETWYWPGQVSADNVVMSGVKCSGTEMSLSHCLHHGQDLVCPKGGARYAAGVSCTETAPDLVLNANAVEHTTYLEDRPMFMLQCAYEENCLASTAVNAPANSYRRLLRFSSQIHNNGQSDFRPKAGRHSWVWHDCHRRHYHSMEVFTHYDLLSLNGSKVAEGHKASFCLEDSECDEGIYKRYECANFGEQGITVGCWDTYRHDIDCQWVDITDVKPGDYIFQVVINPNFEVAESDYSNNVMKCRCRYDGHRIWMYNCHIGESFY